MIFAIGTVLECDLEPHVSTKYIYDIGKFDRFTGLIRYSKYQGYGFAQYERLLIELNSKS